MNGTSIPHSGVVSLIGSVQAEAPLQLLPTLRKPTKSWLLPGAAQDHTYRVFKTRPLDLPWNFSSSFSKSRPGVLCFVLLCLLNLALLICLDLAYYISDFQNTHQAPPLDLNSSGFKCLFSPDQQVGLPGGTILPATVSDPVQEAHENVEYAV